MNMQHTISTRSQTGAALVVGLILLMVLTVLAISGMSTSTLELQMAGNTQFAAESFHEAERGLEVAIKRPTPAPNPTTFATTPLQEGSASVPTRPNTKYAYRVDHNEDTGVSLVPAGGDEMGGPSGILAYHYEITSTGDSSRRAVSVHTQSYYRKGATPTPSF